jgi:hypothetical protein
MIISSRSSFISRFLDLYENISVPLPTANFAILLLLLFLLPRVTGFRVF